MKFPISQLKGHIQRILPQVYHDTLSHLELMELVIEKLNEVIDSSNEYFSKDLKEYVGEILQGWYSDGTLQEIINNDVFNMKADKTYVTDEISKMEKSVNDTVEILKSDAPFKKQRIATTTGRAWSTSTDDLRYNLNSQGLRLLSAPTNEQRTLVIYGSSTAEGFYGSTGNSWWEKLNAAMSAKGWKVLQRAKSADNTEDGLARFHSDVVPYNPDVVIIAFTLGNEGMTATMNMDSKYTIKERFKRNVLRMASMARQNNIVPIIADQFPTKRYSAGFYQTAQNLNKELDALGLMTINLKGAVDALVDDGLPLNLAMHDDLHPNDTGHNAMFRSINPSMIETIAGAPNYHRPTIGRLYSGVVSTSTAVAPMSFIPKTTIDSFTIFWRMKATNPVVAQRTWGAVNSNGLRVSNQGDAPHSLDLRGGGMSAPIISVVGLDDLKEHSVAITFSSISKFVKFYVDGKLIGTDSSPDLVLDEFTLANRRDAGVLGHSMGFKDFTVYRARLSDQQIRDLHNGHIYMGGLDVFAPLGETIELEGRFANLAPTDEALEANTNGIYIIE